LVDLSPEHASVRGREAKASIRSGADKSKRKARRQGEGRATQHGSIEAHIVL
jgi:head-tail adaptor